MFMSVKSFEIIFYGILLAMFLLILIIGYNINPFDTFIHCFVVLPLFLLFMDVICSTYCKHNYKEIKSNITIKPTRIIYAKTIRSKETPLEDLSIPIDLYIYENFIVMKIIFNKAEIIEYTHVEVKSEEQKILKISLPHKKFDIKINHREDYDLILFLKTNRKIL